MKNILGIIFLVFFLPTISFSEITIPVSINILQINEDGYKTNINEEQAKKAINKLNEIYSKTKINFDITNVKLIKSGHKNFSKAKNKVKEYKKKEKRVFYNKLIRYSSSKKDQHLNIYFIPKLVENNAQGVYLRTKSMNPNEGYILITTFTPYLGILLAHEVGHVFNIKHKPKTGNGYKNRLMDARFTGTVINDEEAKQMRDFYYSVLKKHFK
jgi:hypothetical protein